MGITYPPVMRETWSIRPWQRNMLLRRTDRIRFYVHVTMAMLIALTVPLTVAAGTTVYRQVEIENAAATAAGHVASGKPTVAHSPSMGARVPMRVHKDGARIPQTAPSTEPALDAVLAALLLLGVVDVAVLVLWRVWCRSLDRREHKRWAYEWELIDLAVPRRR